MLGMKNIIGAPVCCKCNINVLSQNRHTFESEWQITDINQWLYTLVSVCFPPKAAFLTFAGVDLRLERFIDGTQKAGGGCAVLKVSESNGECPCCPWDVSNILPNGVRQLLNITHSSRKTQQTAGSERITELTQHLSDSVTFFNFQVDLKMMGGSCLRSADTFFFLWVSSKYLRGCCCELSRWSQVIGEEFPLVQVWSSCAYFRLMLPKMWKWEHAIFFTTNVCAAQTVQLLFMNLSTQQTMFGLGNFPGTFAGGGVQVPLQLFRNIFLTDLEHLFSQNVASYHKKL